MTKRQSKRQANRCPAVYPGEGQCHGRRGHLGKHNAGGWGGMVWFTDEEAALEQARRGNQPAPAEKPGSGT